MSRQINLYNPALLKKRQLLSADSLAIAAALLLLAMVAWSTVVRIHAGRLGAESAPLEARLTAAREQVLALGKKMTDRHADPALQNELDAMSGMLVSRQTAMGVLERGLGRGATAYSAYLRGFARETPAGVWLTGFTVGEDGKGLEIRGRTTDPALVAEYIRRLAGDAAFAGRSFAAMQMGAGVRSEAAAAQSAPAYYDFTLSPVLPKPGPGQERNP